MRFFFYCYLGSIIWKANDSMQINKLSREMTFICFLPKCVWADAPVNINHAACSPVFVLSFVNQRTFPHWFWIQCSLCMQRFHWCYKVTDSLLMNATCSGIFSISCGTAVILLASVRRQPAPVPSDVVLYVAVSAAPLKGSLDPEKKDLWFPALKCNPLLRVSPWILCSYQLLQDETLSIQQPQPPPILLISTRPIFTLNPGQTAIKTSALRRRGGRVRTTDL